MLLQRMKASRPAGLPWGDGAHRRAAPANGSSVTQHYHRGPVRAALRTNGSSGEATKHYIVQASGGYGPTVPISAASLVTVGVGSSVGIWRLQILGGIVARNGTAVQS